MRKMLFDSDNYMHLPEEIFITDLSRILRENLSNLGKNIQVKKTRLNTVVRDYINLEATDERLVRELYIGSLEFPESTLHIELSDNGVSAQIYNFLTSEMIELWSFERGF